MKKFSVILALMIVISLLAGCAGTPVVYYSNCTCPEGSHTAGNNVPHAPEEPTVGHKAPAAAEGALKTGLFISTNVSESKSASAEENGEVEYDITVAAVLVDDKGVIVDCKLDSIGASVLFDGTGAITSDVNAEILTKNELGDSYNMKLYGGAKYEWYEQAEALAQYAIGKTVEELKTGAVSESGYAADADLASTATIYLGGYVSCIEGAVNNAGHLGAQAGDELKMTTISSLASSVSADGENAGTAQLDVDAVALTVNGDVITSCYIDALQAKISFDSTGTITSDLSTDILTKVSLGEHYNMKLYGGAKYEWNEQAASFAAYVTGKTAAEVAGIAVSEGKPMDADLAASVTISIGGFQALIAKAVQ